MGTSVVSIFAGLALNVMVSSINHAFILTIPDASSAKVRADGRRGAAFTPSG